MKSFAISDWVPPQISQLSNAGIGAVSAQLQFTNGLTGDLLIHTDCGQLAEQYDIFGSGYRICVDYFHGLTVYESDQIVYQQMYPQAIPIPQREGAITELEAFLDHVESGDLILSPNPNDALAAAWVSSGPVEVAFFWSTLAWVLGNTPAPRRSISGLEGL